MKRIILLLCAISLFGCGGGGSTAATPTPTPSGSVSFFADDFTTNSPYTLNATKVGEGVHCYVYLEEGQTVSPSAVSAIISQFDSNIYPNENAAYGSEPNPGVDGDPKVYILLLKVRDGFTPGVSTSFIAGFFDPTDEFPVSAVSHSNQKEILFMNINPAVNIDPSGVEFFATVAHEFQHMIHWEQKTHRQGVHDDTWIDEAMSQVARAYCGYGPDYASVLSYELEMSQNTIHSLTAFDNSVGNYGMVYMWSQYLKDRLDASAAANTGHTIFWQILNNTGTRTGISAVTQALVNIGSVKDFTSVFRDWAMANYFGDGSSVAVPPGNPDWTYTSINTWPGTHVFNNGQNRVTIPGFFPLSKQNPATLRALGGWSLNYYLFTPQNPPTGTVTWTRSASTAAASFINGNNASASVIFDVISGAANTFNQVGYLIDQNPSSLPAPVNGVARTAVSPTASTFPASVAASSSPPTPMETLSAMEANPAARRYLQETGRPLPGHVDPWLRERERELWARGFRPGF